MEDDDDDDLFGMWKELLAKRRKNDSGDDVPLEWNGGALNSKRSDDVPDCSVYSDQPASSKLQPSELESAQDSDGANGVGFCNSSKLLLDEGEQKDGFLRSFNYAWKQKAKATERNQGPRQRSRGADAVFKEDKKKAYRCASLSIPSLATMYGSGCKSLGYVNRDFKPPVHAEPPRAVATEGANKDNGNSRTAVKGVDADLVELIESEIVQVCDTVSWDDLCGLAEVKSAIKEAVIWPMLRPDIFTGLRAPCRGMLLFGPPGTGKTLIGRCIASQCAAVFFNISASSLMSKWVGEGEKLVKALFCVARLRAPSVIFIDEVDSLLSRRSESDHESSRRMKNEFFSQIEGVSMRKDERLLLIGATNRPQELDDAALRRFTRRLYVPLPDVETKGNIIKRLLTGHKHTMSETDISSIAELSERFSGADITELCREAALVPLRDLKQLEDIPIEQLPSISIEHFRDALLRVKSTVPVDALAGYDAWNTKFGFTGVAKR